MSEPDRPPYPSGSALTGPISGPMPSSGGGAQGQVPSSRDSNPSLVTGETRLSMPEGELDQMALPRVCPTCHVRYPPEFKVCPRDASELEDAEDTELDELIGTTLNDTYHVVRALGEGGMGRVYEARHRRIGGKRFAIKILHPEFARRPDVLSRFQREAEAAASIDSRHVVQVFDVHRTAEGRPFLVCEFLEGVELAEHLQHEGKVSTAFAIRVTRQLCKAMAAAHALGIVHRDMKPENVFLTGNISAPIAKVIDFGISKTGDTPGTQLTKTGMIMGTPSFMAPEQAKGLKVSHLVDVYAVGAILYNMVTGQRPFDRNDPTATLTAVLIEDPPRPRSLEPSISESLEAVIQRAMAKESGERYANMTELDAALAPFDTAGSVGESLRPPMPGLPGSAAFAGTLMGGAGIERRDHAAGLARPTIMLMVGLGFFAASGFVMTLITSLVRISRGGDATANLSGAEAAVLSLVVIVALVAPVVLAVKHYKSTVWGNTARAVDTADRLKGPVMTSLAAYGGASLLVRIIETVMLRRAVGAAWPTWDLLMVLIALGAAGAYALVLRLENRRAN